MALKNGIVLSGADGVAAALKRLNRKLPNRMGATMEAMGNLVIDDAKSRTPIDTGDLVNSAFVSRAQVSATGRYTHVEIGYGFGGVAEEYALIQHENEQFSHPHGGEAHYLLNALRWASRQGAPKLRALIYSELLHMLGRAR